MKQWFFTVFSSSSEFNDPELQPKCDYMNKRLYFKKYYNKLRISSFESVFYHLKCFTSPTVVILVRMQHLHIIIWTTNKQNNVFTSQERVWCFCRGCFRKLECASHKSRQHLNAAAAWSPPCSVSLISLTARAAPTDGTLFFYHFLFSSGFICF